VIATMKAGREVSGPASKTLRFGVTLVDYELNIRRNAAAASVRRN